MAFPRGLPPSGGCILSAIAAVDSNLVIWNLDRRLYDGPPLDLYPSRFYHFVRLMPSLCF